MYIYSLCINIFMYIYTTSAITILTIPSVTTTILYSDVVWPDLSTGSHPGVLPRDCFQNKRFKLIPAMVEAPWVVQMAVR